jgi:phosphate:Na+ symporter
VTPPAHAILGLGLFFLGMRLVGEHLRRLAGESFRRLVAEAGESAALGTLLGLAFGALLQSATAVTFVLVSMVEAGLVSIAAALPVLVWTNVGLTALAMVASLDVRALAAYLVGGAGIAMAFLRRPAAYALAAVALGGGLLFLGLGEIGTAVAPLRGEPWFGRLIAAATRAPLVGFLVGVAFGALAQSNTAATLIVVALADRGALSVSAALPVVYGTNLGAIGLRWVLSAGLRGSPLRLVRFEDLFCLCGGALMLAADLLERGAHVPLVEALVAAISARPGRQVALAFVVSNLLPALVLAPALGPVARWLERRWPATSEEEAAMPRYLAPQALDDPPTAVDLLQKELARLIAGLAGYVHALRSPQAARAARVAAVTTAFHALAARIAEFDGALAGRDLDAATLRRLALCERQLALTGYLQEALAEVVDALAEAALPRTDLAGVTADLLAPLLDAVVATLQAPDAAGVARINAAYDRARAEIARLRERLGPAHDPATERLVRALSAADLAAWMLHHFRKLLPGAPAAAA